MNTHIVQLLEEQRAVEEETLQWIEEEEKQKKLTAFNVAARRSKEVEVVSAVRGPSRATPWPATATQLDIPAELALIMQALASKTPLSTILVTSVKFEPLTLFYFRVEEYQCHKWPDGSERSCS